MMTEMSTAHLAVASIILGLIILSTIIGNSLVIAAVLLERNLRSVANYLIASLAVADLLVASLVMPLAAVKQMTSAWLFGPLVCNVYVSLDVICCTSSILHLVSISLDRYWAVTRVDYARNRSALRIGGMIAFSWTLSAIISIAPLVGWGRTGQWATVQATDGPEFAEMTTAVDAGLSYNENIKAGPNHSASFQTFMIPPDLSIKTLNSEIPESSTILDVFSISNNSEQPEVENFSKYEKITSKIRVGNAAGEELKECIISQDKSYTIFSTVVAFYIPLIFIIIIYVLIYRAARDRIRGGRHAKNWTGGNEITKTSIRDASPEGTSCRRMSNLLLPRTRGKSHSICTTGELSNQPIQVQRLRASVDAVKLEALTETGLTKLKHSSSAVGNLGMKSQLEGSPRKVQIGLEPGDMSRVNAARASFASTNCSMGSFECTSYSSDGQLSTLSEEGTTPNKEGIPTYGKDRLKRLRTASAGTTSEAARAREKRELQKERKAARTLAIITGSFMICWMPFFILALIHPFCGAKCDPPALVRSIIDWLGFVNSLLNPIIYTIFSPDFRSAFRKILYGRYASRRHDGKHHSKHHSKQHSKSGHGKSGR